MAGKTKQMMFCPWCEEGQARTWQGMTAHVRAKHPDKITELKDNKEMYLEKFACDEFGNPTESPEPPESEEKPEPEPKPAPAPKQNPKPEEPPAPKDEGDPAPEGGLFHRISTGIFG